MGSLVITVGGSFYTQSLQKTKARVVDTRFPGARSNSPKAGASSPENRGARPGATTSSPPPGRPPKKPLGQMFRDLPWKRIAGLTAGLFVAAMAIILVFELTTGKPVSSFTGGSSETRTGTTFSDLNNPGDAESEESETEDPGEDVQQPDGESVDKEKPTQDQPAEEKQPDPEPLPEPPVEDQPESEE